MIKLREEFNKKGLHFKQIFRDDTIGIYSVVDEKHNYGFYEVFRITIHKPDKFHPDEYELYPYDEAFGLFAWCASEERIICKVLYLNFPEHPLTKQLMKYATGETYTINKVEIPMFKLNHIQLLEELYIYQNRPGDVA